MAVTRTSRQNPAVREFILANVQRYPDSLGNRTAKQFGLSRTSVARYMNRLVAEGLIIATGKTFARRYQLREINDLAFEIEIGDYALEDVIWRHRLLPELNGQLNQNVLEICQYGFTEILNNVFDHSRSNTGILSFKQNASRIQIMISDQGVGIFQKIRDDFGLTDAREAILELAKGKLTSDSANHSGEGIFFTSRMFDSFTLISGDLCYLRERSDDDEWLIEIKDTPEYQIGTCVFMVIAGNSDRTMRGVFNEYQGKDYSFRKTHVPVKLSKYPGEELVSRSQAKRVLSRFDKFTEIMLDFDGIDSIGQGFADEIFRVFPASHPDIKIVHVRTNSAVREMIEHVQNAGENRDQMSLDI